MRAAGFETKVAIEFVESCVETYKANHPEVHTIHSDIRKVTAEDILPYIPKEGVDLVTSGMPCETFSNAGNTSRSFYDDRQFLFEEGIRIAEISKAKMILFENVPGIRTKTVQKDSDKLILDVLKEELVKAGYTNYKEFVLKATDYGVPQDRRRFFILASKDKSLEIAAPEPVTPDKPVTVREAFADLPDVVANSRTEATQYKKASNKYTKLMRNNTFWKMGEGKRNQKVTFQYPMNHTEGMIKRFSMIAPGEGLDDLFEKNCPEEIKRLQEEKILPKKAFAGRCQRLVADKPSGTVTSHCLEEFVHPTDDRALTVRECARLQSFPDAYVFCGPNSVGHDNRQVQDKYEQIGDAVPPLLAYAWGKKISEILKG